MDVEENEGVPQSFMCPLTLAIMTDPVVDPEGNSYERKAIENWLSNHTTSPITRNPLFLHELVPNRALKNAIEEYLKNNQGQNIPVAQIPVVDQKKEEEVPPVQPMQIDSPDKVEVEVCTSRNSNLGCAQDEALIMTTLIPSKGTEKRAVDLCCVVDVSGSMGTEATTQTASGGRESHGLSILDIVKHAVKTIVSILHPGDRLSLVVYSDTARTVFDLTNMDSNGKSKAMKAVESLQPEDQTNLWDGLHTGLEILRKAAANDAKKDRLRAVLLLTDGQPNVVPPRGHLPMLRRYKDQHKQLSCSINTFGFGYQLDSELLRDLAIEGSGMYAFIPDSGFVGTAFVHTTSNLLATMATNVQLSVELQNGVTLVEENAVVGGHPHQIASWGVRIDLGMLQYEQKKSIMLRVKLPNGEAPQNLVNITLKYDDRNGSTQEIKAEGNWRDLPQLEADIELNYYRLFALDTIREAMKLMKLDEQKEAQAKLKELIGKINKSKNKSEALKDLQEDLTGQVTEAFSRADWYKRWGVHYLPSLINAHLLQICNNFKDPGVQHYGSELFASLRDRADDIFVKLPPPKPSVKPAPSSNSYHYRAPAPIQSMSYYHSSSAPCFHSDCEVQMANGTMKKVKYLRQGDRVLTGANKSAKVLCVVKTVIQEGATHLVALGNGLLITPFHPVKVDGRWQFPCDLAEVKMLPCDSVYSFVLEEGGDSMFINGIECVSLGHSLQEGVAKHPYFGSPRILHDLQQFRGWSSGLIQIRSGCLVRDRTSMLVCSLDKSLEI